MRPAHTFRLACAASLAAGLTVLPGATASGHAPATVRITERDFSISSPKHLRRGDLRLVVRNNGPDTHELIVLRAGRTRLPLRSDGLTVDEEALQGHERGALEPGPPGRTRTLELHLAPGRYVLLCNMSGHYLGGMHTMLVVR